MRRVFICRGMAHAALGAYLATFVASGVAAQDPNGRQLSEKKEQQEDIIVTARRFNERLEDVPVAASVLTDEDQERLVLDNMQDYVRQTPGALLVNAGPDYLNDISIRGQGGGRNGFSDSATGIYRNGIYVAGGGFGGRAFSRLDYFDNERVEVFRGPQGALYGRSAVGGAVNVVSRRPVFENGAWGSLSYNDAERVAVEAVGNVALGNKTAVRFGGFLIDQNGGDITELGSGRVLDQQRYLGGRVALRQDFGGGWEVRLTYEYHESEGPSFGVLGQRLNPGIPGRTFDPDPFVRQASFFGDVNINEHTVFAELEGELGFANLALIYTYKNRRGARQDDFDKFLGLEGTPGLSIIVDQSEDFERHGAEIRLSSNPGGPLTWLAGADVQSLDSFVITDNNGTTAPNAPIGLRNQAVRRIQSLDELSSASVFGLIDYKFSDRFSASIEARYQYDERQLDFLLEELTRTVTQASRPSFDAFLPAATLSYKVNNEQTLFLRGSSGYRPGGFNGGVSDIDTLVFGPERAYNVELGYKGRLPRAHMRFELVGYHNWNKDQQLVTQTSLTDTSTSLQNGGDARMYGIEATIGGRSPIGQTRLDWNISAAHQNGEFAEGSSILIQGRRVDLSGARVNRTRDLILNASAFLNAPLSDTVTLFGGGSIRVERGGFENATGGTADATGRELDDFEIVDARAGLMGDGWTVSLFGKNIFNQTIILQNISQNNYFNERSRFGIEARFRFGAER